MGLVVGVNYVWCLVIVVIFIGLGGAKKRGETLKTSSGVAMQATKRDSFYGKEGSHYVILLY